MSKRNLPLKLISKAREKGLRRSARLAANIASNQLKNVVRGEERQYIFISNPVDHTGAPMVLLEIIQEFVTKYGSKRVRVIVPGATPAQRNNLKAIGVKIEKAALDMGPRLLSIQLGLRKDDFVLINTLAIYHNYRNFLINALKNDSLRHVHWFIHEDEAQLPYVDNSFLQTKNLKKVSELVKSKKLSIYVPTIRTKEQYDKILNTSFVNVVPLRVDVPAKFQKARPLSDYDSLRFYMTGAPSDGRKGQLVALAALQKFYDTFYQKNPSNYRDFQLTLIGLGDDYISQQISWIGSSMLDGRLKIYSQVPREEVLAIYSLNNAVICCSLNETFGLYIAEGMFMNNLILRNNSAGVDEQLQNGVNGYYIDHTDLKQFVNILEKILNKNKTSNKNLQAMGIASHSIIAPYANNTFLKYFI